MALSAQRISGYVSLPREDPEHAMERGVIVVPSPVSLPGRHRPCSPLPTVEVRRGRSQAHRRRTCQPGEHHALDPIKLAYRYVPVLAASLGGEGGACLVSRNQGREGILSTMNGCGRTAGQTALQYRCWGLCTAVLRLHCERVGVWLLRDLSQLVFVEQI